MKLVASKSSSLQGEVSLPGDKSLSHRAALLAALADGESRVENFLQSGVTKAMLNALSSLDVPWGLEGDSLTVHGKGLHGLKSPQEPIDCGNSGTTMRLLTGALAAAGVSATLDGSSGLRRRPMKRIIDPLQRMGVAIQGEDDRAPLKIKPAHSPLRAIDYQLPVASAQVKSCLLLAALSADGATTLREPGPSRDHTERMLNSMGVPVSRQPLQTQGAPDQQDTFITRLIPPASISLTPLNLRLPGDISSAAFIIVAALITPGSEILIQDVGLNPTRTGLLDALLKMGADIHVIEQETRQGEPVGNVRVRSSSLKGIQVSGPLVVRMIDEFPAFAVAAAYATGQTRVSGAQELRHKESDRITALCTEISTIGIDIEETPDGFVISGGAIPTGGKVDPHGDHRLAMALAIAGLNSQEPVWVDRTEIISESFPGFASTLTSIGAELREQV